MVKLSDYIGFNGDFRESVNLYLDLNKAEKIKSFIPTKSSIDILSQYLDSVVNNRIQSTLLIGPYGKGKSHLLLLLMAILSMDRDDRDNQELIMELKKRIAQVDENAALMVGKAWEKGRFLPVLISSSQGDLNQAFMVGLNESLKRTGLTDIAPDTYYSYALETIKRWKTDFPETFKSFESLVAEENNDKKALMKGLEKCEPESLDLFKKIYPRLTSGSVFNPLIDSEVLPMYSKIADALVEDCGFSGIYIIFDEFSKYIESQDNTSAGSNMKILQDVCELANASKNAQVFITMVAHKSIKEYGHHLSAATINSFTGIEGRIREVFFTTSAKNNYELIQNAIIKKKEFNACSRIENLISKDRASKFFGLSPFKSEFTFEDFERIVVQGCYPLTPVTAYLLLNVSEKVAQNERTLFTFISKEEQYSVANFVKNVDENQEWIVGADLIYDYFKGLFKKDVTNRFVHNVWLQAEYALSHATSDDQKSMLKALAIISIVNKPEELPADDSCLYLAANVKDPVTVIKELEDKNLIYKKTSTNNYVFKTRATSELKTEIKKRVALKAGKTNYSRVLSQVSETHFVLPKRYNHDFAMTRYFRYEYMDVQAFLDMQDISAIITGGEFCDGKIIALYSLDEQDYSMQIRKHIEEASCNRIGVVYQNGALKREDLFAEYEVIQEIKEDVAFLSKEENKVLITELDVVREDIEQELIRWIDAQYGELSERKVYYWVDGTCHETQEALGVVVDKLAFSAFPAAIRVNNELINKRSVSTAPIKKARKEIIDRLLLKEDTSMYLSGTSSESTIYRALFVGTKIVDGKPDQNEKGVLDCFSRFLEGAINKRQSMSVLMDELTAPPIGMREGIIPIFLSYAISQRSEDIVVYFGKREVELNGDIVLNMCESPSDYEIFISSDDAEKSAYIQNMIALFGVKVTENTTDTRINQIVTTMQRWYRSLPQVTKNIKKSNPFWTNMRLGEGYSKFKEMMQSVDANSYEILFVNISKAFKTTDLSETYKLVSELKIALEGYYENFLERVVQVTAEVFGKKENQNLYHVLSDWYTKQSEVAKNGLHSSKITGLMSLLRENNIFDDKELIKKVAKLVTDIYVDSWNDTSIDAYACQLQEVKAEIEGLGHESVSMGKSELRFVGKSGEVITKYYEPVDEGTGSILRNILTDTLEDFSDLSVNDKVAILLEMIEKELN